MTAPRSRQELLDELIEANKHVARLLAAIGPALRQAQDPVTKEMHNLFKAYNRYPQEQLCTTGSSPSPLPQPSRLAEEAHTPPAKSSALGRASNFPPEPS